MRLSQHLEREEKSGRIKHEENWYKNMRGKDLDEKCGMKCSEIIETEWESFKGNSHHLLKTREFSVGDDHWRMMANVA